MKRHFALFIWVIMCCGSSIAQDTMTVAEYAPLQLKIRRACMSEGHPFFVSYRKNGKVHNISMGNIPTVQANCDSCRIEVRQLDGKGLPEVILRCSYNMEGHSSMGGSELHESEMRVWNLDSAREIFYNVNSLSSTMWQSAVNGEIIDSVEVGMENWECSWGCDVNITTEGAIVIYNSHDAHSSTKSDGAGKILRTDSIETESCIPEMKQAGVYRIGVDGYYKMVDEAANDKKHKAHVDDLSAFIPAGYKVKDSVSADLNADTRMDMIMILGPDFSLDSAHLYGYFKNYNNMLPQPVVILIRDEKERLKQAVRNDLVIPYDSNSSMPDPIIAVTGSFTISGEIEMNEKACVKVAKFKYSGERKDWLLDIAETECNDFDDQGNLKGAHIYMEQPGELRFKDYDFRKTRFR